ncbi:hypothetical protein AAMO2058_000483700 [Amorphochlora amoebiformis]
MGSACSRRDGRKGQVHEEDTRAEKEEDKPGAEDGEGWPVYLNVYNILLANHTTVRLLGFGIYHTGVQVHNEEFSYAGHRHTESTGLKITNPRDTTWIHDAVFREMIPMGRITKNRSEVRAVFESMKGKYFGPSYNVLDRNCNHFTREFLTRLGVDKQFPSYICTASRNAGRFRSCLPDGFKTDLREQTKGRKPHNSEADL